MTAALAVIESLAGESTAHVCEAVSALLGTPCGDVAEARYLKVCEHEHVVPKWLCAGHAGDGWAICGPCFLSPESPHKCAVRLVPCEVTP